MRQTQKNVAEGRRQNRARAYCSEVERSPFPSPSEKRWRETPDHGGEGAFRANPHPHLSPVGEWRFSPGYGSRYRGRPATATAFRRYAATSPRHGPGGRPRASARVALRGGAAARSAAGRERELPPPLKPDQAPRRRLG